MTLPRRPGPLTALAAALAVAATACGGQEPRRPVTAATTAAPSPTPTACRPTASAKTPEGGLPDPKDVDQRDATAVARAAVTVMWTVDSAIDRGQRDAYLRACPYLTPDYAARVAAEQAVGPLPQQWRDHRAYAEVRLELRQPEGDLDPDTPTMAYRQWQVTVTPTGRDEWKGRTVRAIAFVTLTRASPRDPWRVARVSTA
ncbi:hypothetical protein [Actinomadura keratinilytica]|uniref:Lipoprotein n=1 Tax=Actinomadura keratinilytica TaxID=547461 RepID=A0ABP7YT26_9ACTN